MGSKTKEDDLPTPTTFMDGVVEAVTMPATGRVAELITGKKLPRTGKPVVVDGDRTKSKDPGKSRASK